MIPKPARSDRSLLAVSFVFLAVAGLLNTSLESIVHGGLAAGLAIAGVYGLALYAKRASRHAIARLTLCFWLSFLAIAAVHAIGVATVAAAAPGSSAVLAGVVTGATWATLISAFASTAFLGLREYGAPMPAEHHEEQLLDGEYDV